MMKFKILFLLAACLSMSACKDGSALVTISNWAETFEATGTGSYKQTSSESDYTVVTVVKNQMDTKSEHNTAVAGITYKGYSTLTLTQENGHIYVVTESLIDDVINGYPMNVRESHKSEATFTQGNWEDYLSGKEVKLAFTAASEESAAQAAGATMKNAMLQGARNQPGLSDLKVDLEQVQYSGQTVIAADLKKVTVTRTGNLLITLSLSL